MRQAFSRGTEEKKDFVYKFGLGVTVGVPPVSLFLSIRANVDEKRVQSEAPLILGEVKWTNPPSETFWVLQARARNWRFGTDG